MFRTLGVARERWPLSRPFRISRGVKTEAEVVVVELSQDGATGRGESVPYARYGETPDSVLEQVEGVRRALETGADRSLLTALLPPGAARNAVDCALWDLEARLSGLSVARALGLAPPEGLATAVTVSLDHPDRMAQAAAAVAHAPLLKIKVDAEDPKARIRAVADAAPAARLIVDPNESWTFDLLDELQPFLSGLNVDLLEQPLPAAEEARLEGWTPAVSVCADESAHTSADLERLRGRYQAVNVKLDKTGGLTEGAAMLRAARAMGFQVMVGCMISTSLSIAPAALLAAQADFADLDGPWWMKQDRAGGFGFSEGRMMPTAAGFWGESAHNLGL